MANRNHAQLERTESLMACVAGMEFGLRRLERRMYNLCAMPILTDLGIESVQEEMASLWAIVAQMRRRLQKMRNEQ
jgi:hypothetical protein